MATGRVTLRDIAAQVGVHASTVSRVLNPETRGMVSPEVAARVTEAVQSLGYYPNPAAYGLRTNRSSTIGVVVTDIANPLFPPIIRGIEDHLIETGYISIICSSDQRLDRKQRIIEIMRRRQVDGVILTTTERSDPLLLSFRKEDMPIVLVQHGFNDSDAPAIYMNDRLGTRYIIDHLVSLGHRRIALISGPQRFSGAFGRHRLLIRAMTENGLAIDPSLAIFTEDFSFAEGVRCCNALLETGARFTAIVAGYDIVAVGCYEALRQHGLACPDDVSVVGYNDVGLPAADDRGLRPVRVGRRRREAAAQPDQGRRRGPLLPDHAADPDCSGVDRRGAPLGRPTGVGHPCREGVCLTPVKGPSIPKNTAFSRIVGLSPEEQRASTMRRSDGSAAWPKEAERRQRPRSA